MLRGLHVGVGRVLGLEDAENDGKEKQHGDEGSEQIVQVKVRLMLLISSDEEGIKS